MQSYKRKPQRVQRRSMPLFEWADMQGRPLSYGERQLRRNYGLSIHRARLISELQGYGARDG